MTSGETDTCIKDQPALYAFVERATGRLAGIRNGILIFDQDRSSDGDIDLSIRNLQLLRKDAVENERDDIVGLVDECGASLRSLLASEPAQSEIGRSLDLVAKIEESLLKIPLDSDDFLPDISGFVDRSFNFLKVGPPASMDAVGDEDFDVDEETLEIFRAEAGELLENIQGNVRRLQEAADDREALWEVRRNAHTFKGAAGIVGLKAASELAHRVEDLLDKLVESNSVVFAEVVSLLSRASRQLEAMALGDGQEEEAEQLDTLYAEFKMVMATVSDRRAFPVTSHGPAVGAVNGGDPGRSDTVRPAAAPIVRVSLDRLDDLIKLSRALTMNRSAMFQRFAEFADDDPDNRAAEFFEKLASLFEAQRSLTDEVQEKLLGIRLVRFGTLETRLNRAVHVTCQEENKKAGITLENGDCEIDTQIIDALIEPLLHLLKNAVVHGIEPPETRRLIGKPEKGAIRVRVDSDESGVTLIVEDDGRGISALKLKQRAVGNQMMSMETAESISEAEAFNLIFRRGLTTADKIDLNAGRGIGMSIVKESIESHGGSVAVASEPQKGSAFTIRMPLVLKKVEVRARPAVAVSEEPRAFNGNSKLVLIVDDSATIRRQTIQLVEEAGHQAITAANGAEAMELLLSDVWRPDLILSDIEMPMMDGWEFLECVKNTESLRNIPIVIVTSLNADEHRHRALLLGAADYKIKPIGRDGLMSVANPT